MAAGWAAALEASGVHLRDGDAYSFVYVYPALLDDAHMVAMIREDVTSRVAEDHAPREEVRTALFTHDEMRTALEALSDFDHPTHVPGDPAVVVAYYCPRKT